MTYAAHRVNVLSMHAAASKPLCWATTPAELPQGLFEDSLGERRAAFFEWHERICAWPRLAEQFARALRIPAA